jgi:hypothetical protein
VSFWHAEGRIHQGDPLQGRPAELSVPFAQAICRAYVEEFRNAWRVHDHKVATAVAVAHDELSAAIRAALAYQRQHQKEPS